MTYEPTTPEEAAKVKRYFTEKIASLKRTKAVYRERLFQGLDRYDPETWDKIITEHPESAISFLTYRSFVETFEILNIFVESIIQSEQNIKKLDDNLKLISNKNHVDISTVTKDVADLKQTILPAVKGMVNFIDRVGQEDIQRKKNGETMIV